MRASVGHFNFSISLSVFTRISTTHTINSMLEIKFCIQVEEKGNKNCVEETKEIAEVRRTY